MGAGSVRDGRGADGRGASEPGCACTWRVAGRVRNDDSELAPHLHKRASVEKLWAPRWPIFGPRPDIGTRGGDDTRPQRGKGVRLGVQRGPVRGEV